MMTTEQITYIKLNYALLFSLPSVVHGRVSQEIPRKGGRAICVSSFWL